MTASSGDNQQAQKHKKTDSPDFTIEVSIVVTTRDRKKDLLDCLRSIRESSLSRLKYELIVIDDASSDATRKLESKDLKTPNSRIIHNKSVQMMVRARNIGVKESVGEYILFIDDDNIIDPEMITTLVSFIRQSKSYGIVGPSMYYFDSQSKYLDYQKISLYTGYTAGVVSEEEKQVYDTDGIPNVFMIRKVIFDNFGFFDEGLIQTFTEPDFAKKVASEGIKCGIVSGAKTYHKVNKRDNYTPRGLGGKFVQKAYCLMRNRTVYISRYGSLLNKVVYLLFFSLFWPLVYSFIALIHKRFDLLKIYWVGFCDGLYYFFTGNLRNSLANK